MIIFKAYKFRIYPDNNQINLIHQIFGCTRFVYNYFLTKKDEYYRETKKMIEKKERKILTKGIVNACFSEIVKELEYKTKWYFKKLIKVNTYYPSSKICSHCGTKNEINDLSIRDFVCINCNNVNDRDINASINILDEGIRIAMTNNLLNV